jgi:hypothetical protein
VHLEGHGRRGHPEPHVRKQEYDDLRTRRSHTALTVVADSDRIAEYDMKLLDIDSDQLGIPDTDYDARVTMGAPELTRIMRDLAQLGESVRIEVSKDGVRFVSDGEAANGSVLLKQTEGAARRYADYDEGGEAGEGAPKKKVKKEDGEDVDMQEDAEEGAEPEAEAEVADEAEFQARSDDDGEEEQDSTSKKRKKAPAKVLSVPSSPHPHAHARCRRQTARRRRRRKSPRTTTTSTTAGAAA